MAKFKMSGLIAGLGQGMADAGKSMTEMGAQQMIEQQREAAQKLRDERLNSFNVALQKDQQTFEGQWKEKEFGLEEQKHRDTRTDSQRDYEESKRQFGVTTRLQKQELGITDAKNKRQEARDESTALGKLYGDLLTERRLFAAEAGNDPDNTAAIDRLTELDGEIASVRTSILNRQKLIGGDAGDKGGEELPPGLPKGSIALPDGTFKLPDGGIVRPKSNGTMPAANPADKAAPAPSDGFGGDKGGSEYMKSVKVIGQQFDADIGVLPDTELDKKYIASGLYKQMSVERQRLLFDKTEKLRRLRDKTR